MPRKITIRVEEEGKLDEVLTFEGATGEAFLRDLAQEMTAQSGIEFSTFLRNLPPRGQLLDWPPNVDFKTGLW